MKTPLIICGALGRMGRAVMELAIKNGQFSIKGGVAKLPEPTALDFPLFDNLSSALNHAPGAVVIDFSVASCALENIASARMHASGFLLATTGHGEDTLLALEKAAEDIPIIYAPNTSLMANLLMILSHMAAQVLKESEVSIIDLHHHAKRDAPSGTAIALAKAITHARSDVDITTHSLRRGHVAGEHTVGFYSEFERLELTHRVADRKVFAQGALLAAQFLFDKAPGLYDMKDVLNMNLTIKNKA